MAPLDAFANIATLLTGSTFVWFVVGVLYRLFLHPLATIPGPTLAKITDWYAYNQVRKGRRHLYLLDLHQRYGNVVRTGPNTVSFWTVEALHEIYGVRRANNIKTGFTEMNAILSGSRDLQTIVDYNVHAKRRRTVQHAFSKESLRAAEEFVITRVKIWCSLLGKGCSEAPDGWSLTRDMQKWSQYLMLDILGDLCFGQSFQSMENYSNILPTIVEGSVKLQTHLIFVPIQRLILQPFVLLVKFLTLIGAESVSAVETYKQLIEKMVKERLQTHQEEMGKPKSEQRLDFFHYMMEAEDPETGDKLTMLELVNESGLMVGAGYDTSSTVLDSMFWYLLRKPQTLVKLQKEIRSSFDDVEEIRSGQVLSSLRYLRACLDETLRMAPPVPGTLDRTVCIGGMHINETFIPAGIDIGVPIYAIHHNEEYYPDSWSFSPERWIESSEEKTGMSSEQQVKLARKAFSAFSLGPRGCIGKELAYMDMSIAVARLLFLFDIRLASKLEDGAGNPSLPVETLRHRPDELQLEDWFLGFRTSSKVQFKLAKGRTAADL